MAGADYSRIANYSPSTVRSILAVASVYGIDELLRVIADAVLKDDLDLFNIRNRCGWIAFDDHEVCILAGGDGSDLALLAQVDRPVQGRNSNGLDRRESGLDQKFDFALVTESWDNATVSGGIRPRQ